MTHSVSQFRIQEGLLFFFLHFAIIRVLQTFQMMHFLKRLVRMLCMHLISATVLTALYRSKARPKPLRVEPFDRIRLSDRIHGIKIVIEQWNLVIMITTHVCCNICNEALNRFNKDSSLLRKTFACSSISTRARC
jgi:hypothetical protein